MSVKANLDALIFILLHKLLHVIEPYRTEDAHSLHNLNPLQSENLVFELVSF